MSINKPILSSDSETENKGLNNAYPVNNTMSNIKAVEKEIVKVGIGFKALNMGLVSTMSDEEFEQFMRWLD